MQIMMTDELKQAIWVIYILLGIIPGYLYTLKFHKEWRMSNDQLNLHTQGMWLVDLVVKLIAFMVSLFLWPLVLIEYLALAGKRWYTKTRKGAPIK